MLSSPPRSLAALISAWVAASRRPRLPDQDPLDRAGVDHRRQAVRAEQEDVSVAGLDGEHVDVDVGLGPERARDHRALRVDRRLLGGELTAPHQLGDERVVVGQLLQMLVAQPVGPRVADMPDRDLPVGLEDRNRHRRAHPRRCRVGGGALVHAQVRRLDQRDDTLLAGGARVEPRLGDRGRRRAPRRPRRPARRPSRPRRRTPGALRRSCPRCAAACARHSTPPTDAGNSHRSNLRSVSPIRTRSPGTRRRSRSRRMPLTNVPLVEPMSSM